MSFLLAPAKVRVHEHLDGDDAPADSVHRSLRDLRGINHWLGGELAYQDLVRRACPADHPDLADLGSGTSDLLEAFPRAGRRVGIDFKIEHLIYGRGLAIARGDRRASTVHRVAADAFRIPLRDGSVDVVTSSHFFHHFDEDENVTILTEALRVARVAVAVTDTRRHWIPFWFTRAVAASGLWSDLTRHDAPASVRQGYTLEEVRAIARRLPARRHELVRQLAFRFGLILWK